MAKRSAGVLLYRFAADSAGSRPQPRLQVLLVHPGGPFWRRRDEGAWTIPKGEIAPGEAPLDAARREFREETGFEPPDADAGIELAPVRQSGGKWVMAWAMQGDLDAAAIHSNTFTMEWPPRSGREQEFPEVDRGAWYDLPTAARKINAAQARFLDELADRVLASAPGIRSGGSDGAPGPASLAPYPPAPAPAHRRGPLGPAAGRAASEIHPAPRSVR